MALEKTIRLNNQHDLNSYFFAITLILSFSFHPKDRKMHLQDKWVHNTNKPYEMDCIIPFAFHKNPT